MGGWTLRRRNGSVACKCALDRAMRWLVLVFWLGYEERGRERIVYCSGARKGFSISAGGGGTEVGVSRVESFEAR